MYHRIRDLREDKDLTQTAVARMLGMSQTGYSKYETGENDVPTAILIRLARYYHVSIDYLLGQTNEKNGTPKCRKPRKQTTEHRRTGRKNRGRPQGVPRTFYAAFTHCRPCCRAGLR